jgi:hypothetical protein
MRRGLAIRRAHNHPLCEFNLLMDEAFPIDFQNLHLFPIVASLFKNLRIPNLIRLFVPLKEHSQSLVSKPLVALILERMDRKNCNE